MKLYVKLIDRINAVVKVLGAIIMIFLILAVALQILARFFPIWFKTAMLEELSRFMLIWMAYITLGLSLNSNKWKLVSVDFLREVLPDGRPRMILDEVVNILSLLFCLFMIYIGTKFAAVGSIQKAPATGIRMSYYYASEAVGFSLAVLNWLAARFKRWGAAK